MAPQITDHGETPAGTPSDHDATPKSPILLGPLDGYKTPGRRRLKRKYLRTIYVAVRNRIECNSFDVGQMQQAVRDWTGAVDLELEELLRDFQDATKELTIAVREDVGARPLENEEDVRALLGTYEIM